MSEIQAYENLFKAFNALEEDNFSADFKEELVSFRGLQKRFQPFDDQMKALLQRESPYFNVFSILNIGHLEVKLHTPFLGHLLNPKSNHAHGSLFLDAFLSQVLNLDICFQQMTYFYIAEESTVETGRLDIIINYGEGNAHKAIVIENKTNQFDQHDQLERYFFQMKCILNMPLRDFQIVYLTPQGKQPSPISINPKLADSLRKCGVLIEIGYHKHVIPWLSDCLPLLKSANLKFTLSQYINTIKRL